MLFYANHLRALVLSWILPTTTVPSIDVNLLPNNSLFTTWRPTYHFIAPHSWMNDPNGPFYDPVDDIYHLFYQWHPQHVNWGNISWGHAVSKNLAIWTDVGNWTGSDAMALGPSSWDGTYDRLGIYSGSAQRVSLDGSADKMTIFYTSVQHLPTGWNKTYIPGTETQSLATSSDGGRTWQRYPYNPVIASPPTGWNVTGWRDPFFLLAPELDTLLYGTDYHSPHYYAVFGSGIRGVGPRLPFYSASVDDLTKWTFLGSLIEPVGNASFSKYSGSFGFNFECPGYFSLVEKAEDGGDNETLHYFVNMGTEGGNNTLHPHTHWSLWAEGNVVPRPDNTPTFDIISSGVADWGNLYALDSFFDSRNQRRVSWGWSREDTNSYGILAQGWQGCFALPRELFVQITHNVLNDPSGTLVKKGAWTASQKANGLFTVKTLGMRPLPDVVTLLREHATPHRLGDVKTSTVLDIGIKSMSFQISASFTTMAARAGFFVRASNDDEETTVIAYNPLNQTIVVDRTHSSLITNFDLEAVTGYFILFTTMREGFAQPEAVTLNVFVDNSVLEVYANERFALTTRIYPSRTDSLRIGLFVDGTETIVFQDVVVWDGFQDAWPGRPANSSTKLVYDSATETDSYTWWTGI